MVALPNLTGVFGDLGNLVPSTGDILNNVLAGVAGTVIISGLKSDTGQSALDPMNLFHHAATPATATSPATPSVTGAVNGPVMTMSAFLALTPANQQMVQAMKYTIIPG